MAGLVLMAVAVCRAQIRLGGDAVVTFASAEEGRKILTTRDDFIRALSPFDRAVRLKTDRAVSEEQFLQFVGRSVREWTADEKTAFGATLDRLRAPLDRLALPWPKAIHLIKTTGAEEGEAAYTRGSALILPQTMLTPGGSVTPHLLAHELFHILSRSNPGLRDRLYQAIGFVKCPALEWPEALRNRKVTNPDAPASDHCIRVQLAGTDVWAIPILFSRTAKYDVQRGGEFFDYMEFRLLLVERQGDPPIVKPIYAGSEPRLVDVGQVGGFYEQVGRNTQYIIHPEEILADNFADLVLGNREVPSPEVPQKMLDVFANKPAARP